MTLNQKTPQLIYFPLLAVVYLFAWWLQSTLFLNYDVSWLMLATRRLLAGGTYSRDFFETNPPLILYLYLPPVLLAQKTVIPLTLLFRGYIFLLATGSLLLCSYFINSLFQPKRGWLAFIFSLTVASVFLILPSFDFGQRDHLLVILTLPYFLLIVFRLQGGKPSSCLALGLGVLAGLGFSIKPHFLLAPLLIEAYVFFSQKNRRVCLRQETLALTVTVVIYAISIFIHFPDYLFVVVPFSWRLYYSGVSQPWTSLLLNGGVIYCVFPLLLFLLQRQERSHAILRTILALGLLGFLLVYFSQRMLHYYHLIPSLSFALLLLVVELDALLFNLPHRGPERLLAVFMGVLLLSIPVSIFYHLYARSQNYKKDTLARLTAFMNAHAKEEGVYFFTTAGSYAFPTMEYTTASLTPRFYFLWMAAGLANQALEPVSPATAEQGRRDKNFLINMISDDLYQYKPRYVFVDLSENKYRIKDKNFDYLIYFSENPKFRQVWRKYHYYTTLEETSVYKLGVYKRERI